MILHRAGGPFMKKLFVLLFGVLLITGCVWTENLMATVPSSEAFRLRGVSVAAFPVASLATDKMASSAAPDPQTTGTSTSSPTQSTTTKATPAPAPPPPPPPPPAPPPKKSKKKK